MNVCRFNPERALKRLRGKRLLFVGDSLQRGQWQSFVCMVDTAIPPGKKSLRRGRTHNVFRAMVYIFYIPKPDITFDFEQKLLIFSLTKLL